MNYNLSTVFTILILAVSSFANDWKPDEWLFASPVYLPSPTKAERSKINPVTKEKELYPESFHKRMFEKMPKKIEAKPKAELITPWGTTKWEKVFAVGECPAIKELIPECSIFFAAKYWIAPEAQPAELWFGSDDAAVVWQNGKKIFEYPHGGGYNPDRSVVPVSLTQGTNLFVFAVINGEGPGMVGARLFPKRSAIFPGLFLDTKNPVETENFIELDFYWLPAAILKPRKKVYNNPPKCEKIRLLDYYGNVLTQIVCADTAHLKNIPLNPPSKGDFARKLRVDMRGKSNGIYKIESKWKGEIHTRPFYYCGFPEKLTPSEEWKIEFLKYNDFFAPGTFLEQMFGENKKPDSKGNINVKRIHAYRSKYDDTLQPYIVMGPRNRELKEGLPLIVALRAYIISDKIRFTRRTRYNSTDMVMVWPYSRGCSGYRVLSELDVLEVIELVCEEYKIDRDRIYLDSGSFGAAGNWRLGGRHPDTFAGLIANSGYDLTYVNNLLALPIWQMWIKPESPEYWLPYAIKKMEKFGADATYTDLRKFSQKKSRKYMDEKNRAKWLSGKRKNSQPDKVVYSTYGDVDGAYWVRNIMPDWFGRMATVVAEVKMFSNQFSVIVKEKNKELPAQWIF